ncbi:MAG: transporter [Acidobacteriota bacterium]|nr:transporter [Blastocatellia bacterium]MDW8240976.1 transporter [Acidobacteriota bacterium]
MIQPIALCVCVILALGVKSVFAQSQKIQDNSFLIEEAYNQEKRVVQHIQTFQFDRGNTWLYTFTQEWPVGGQRSQFSYTLPLARLGDDITKQTGLGDIALNYRYQLVLNGPVALAPRFSLLLPTGDLDDGLGTDAVGYQVNIPLSVEIGDKVVTHWNGGFTATPNAKAPDRTKADTLGYNLGGSAIFLARPNFNIMMEAAYFSNEAVVAASRKERDVTFLLNPGMRFAINFKSGLQIVPGIAVPFGIGPSRGDRGIFVYLSLEHPF